VFSNSDTPEDAAEARRNGAEGIGLVRTERKFFIDNLLVRIHFIIVMIRWTGMNTPTPEKRNP